MKNISILVSVALSLMVGACDKSEKKNENVSRPAPSDIRVVDKPAISQPPQEAHVVVSDFRSRCEELSKNYNASGTGQTLNVPYEDWQGNSRESLVTTTITMVPCNSGDTSTYLQVEGLKAKSFFVYTLKRNEEGNLRFDSQHNNCATLVPDYIQKLKDANWSVDETVRKAVERMYNEQFCPSLDAAIQARVGELSQALQQVK